MLQQGSTHNGELGNWGTSCLFLLLFFSLESALLIVMGSEEMFAHSLLEQLWWVLFLISYYSSPYTCLVVSSDSAVSSFNSELQPDLIRGILGWFQIQSWYHHVSLSENGVGHSSCAPNTSLLYPSAGYDLGKVSLSLARLLTKEEKKRGKEIGKRKLPASCLFSFLHSCLSVFLQ